MNLNSRKEIVFFYESIRANPNGDPGFDNQPRMYHDNTVMVTDVRIKRTIRDYAKRADKDNVLFVDSLPTGDAVEADTRAKDLLDKKQWTYNDENGTNEDGGKINKNRMKAGLLAHTFDVPLFGALVTIREGGEGSVQVTGPCQFGMAKSVNKTEIITNQITSKFVGKTERQSTLGTYSVINYALIKCMAIVDPANLEYEQLKRDISSEEENEIKNNFGASVSKLCEYLWKGTNSLNSRSKIPQRSVLLVEVEYKNKSYTDLDTLVVARVKKDVTPVNHATKLEDIEFFKDGEGGGSQDDAGNLSDFESRLVERKDSIEHIRIVRDPRISAQVEPIIERLKKELGENRVERLKLND